MHANNSTTGAPFYITEDEALTLRIAADRISPSPIIANATTFDDFTRQLMIPSSVMELSRKVSNIRFAAWETEAIRASLQRGILKQILIEKFSQDNSHPAYIRVACTGKGDYDDWAIRHNPELSAANEEHHLGDFGSSTVLEIWPAGHYSPIHSHGQTTGIVYCLSGQIEVMAYENLAWDAKKLALLTLTPGQCAWLNPHYFATHRVYCPMAQGSFAATFHVYLNQSELPLLRASPKPHTRDEFEFVDENAPHVQKTFATYSDLSWRILRQEMALYAAHVA